ncbi:MAG: hypothetical protein KGI97_07220 [Alphaproteobacteria bacterium]|nr:hypothetical protein [Alphaproteobacteria bacterium]
MNFADAAKEIFDLACAHPVADFLVVAGAILGGMDYFERRAKNKAERARVEEILNRHPDVKPINTKDFH